MSVTGIISMFSNQLDPNKTSCARSHTHHRASDFETLQQAFAQSPDTPTLTLASSGQNADTATFSSDSLTPAQQAPGPMPQAPGVNEQPGGTNIVPQHSPMPPTYRGPVSFIA